MDAGARAARPGPPIPVRRLGLLALAGASLLAGLSGALALLGVWSPASAATFAGGHGLLMTLGFLGTLISLERAVALGRPWGYLGALATGLGGFTLLLGLPAGLTALLLLAGSGLYVAMYMEFLRADRSLHIAVQALGGLAWLLAAVQLVAGRTTTQITPWLAAFLVLTIAGERLELARLGQLGARARALFVAAAGALGAGVVLSVPLADAGIRLAGAGLLALAAWFAANDIARRTVRFPGVTRFIALCLLTGYAWLALAGGLWLAFGTGGPAFARDAMLHALFLGFVISMVFGHAPVILPAVLRVPLPYHPRYYVHLALLQAGLLVRVVAGDLAGVPGAWQAGGVLTVAAVLVFVGSSAAATVIAVRQGRR
jgi:hypothetical protein